MLIHALDPALFAGAKNDSAWPPTMLGAVAVEDLSQVRNLGVLPLGRSDDALKAALQKKLPQADVTVLPSVRDVTKARDAVAAFFRGG